MTLLIRLFALLFVLSACAPTNPALQSSMQDIVRVANADKGNEIGDGLIADGARIDGDTLVFNFLSQIDPVTFGPVGLETYREAFVQGFASGICGDPASATFINQGGRTQVILRNLSRQIIVNSTLTRC